MKIKVIVETRKAQDRAERLNFGSCAFPECTSYAYAVSDKAQEIRIKEKSFNFIKGFLVNLGNRTHENH